MTQQELLEHLRMVSILWLLVGIGMCTLRSDFWSDASLLGGLTYLVYFLSDAEPTSDFRRLVRELTREDNT